MFSTLPLYLDVKYIPWERKTFNQQIPWTHTHSCAFSPLSYGGGWSVALFSTAAAGGAGGLAGREKPRKKMLQLQ